MTAQEIINLRNNKAKSLKDIREDLEKKILQVGRATYFFLYELSNLERNNLISGLRRDGFKVSIEENDQHGGSFLLVTL